MRKYWIVLTLSLAACNSVNMKPNTLDPNGTIYSIRGGYGMRHAIKQHMEERGYNVLVGKAKASGEYFPESTETVDINYDEIPGDVRYFVKVIEKHDTFRPIWCSLNGFWWWDFNVSIADQKTKQEILSWRGRGCRNSSLRKLDKILDKLEKTQSE